MASRVFFDSSAVIEYCFWGSDCRAKLDNLIQGRPRIVSGYVVFEVFRGYLRNLELLYIKSGQLKKFSQLFTYVSNARMRSHLQGTVCGALQRFFERPAAKCFSDEEQLQYFRSFVRRQIRRGSEKVLILGDVRLNNVGCRTPTKAAEFDSSGNVVLDLGRERCGDRTQCGLKPYCVQNRNDLEALRTALLQQPMDTETRRRVQALRELYRVLKKDFNANDCRSAGDAVIAHECPKDAAILTSNPTHFQWCCNTFGKELLQFVSKMSPKHT